MRKKYSYKKDIFQKGRAILERNHSSILPRILPGGKVIGNEYVATNPNRADKHLGSFKFNLRTGKWCEFAEGIGGNDIISFYAYLSRKSQKEALLELLDIIGERI
ncbi:hypothetical protein [Rickettsiales endosymbiont of Stachyamoeba lipophora]|uniref:hypothetical protein n=1 Tax=Rickettsiales endosymbiont of Stachyamoeba lipophora TaxID=2486578 RepID=UPI000F652DA1|nr:hypothetical protein [Rickettsiales endosymbiont of Stachyamoeba lipophora]AZL15908.1 hypothetical protein EF513_05040 [Rickettsiales endosymbiont of Stachyamoeba lipophora]